MNSIVLIGRITKDLELRTTEGQKSVCNFTLAVNRIGSEQADFINVAVWGKQAENLCEYQGKGSLISVSGALRVDNYEVEGQKKYNTYVSANNIEFLSARRNGEETPVEKKNDPFENVNVKNIPIDDDDLPF